MGWGIGSWKKGRIRLSAIRHSVTSIGLDSNNKACSAVDTICLA